MIISKKYKEYKRAKRNNVKNNGFPFKLAVMGLTPQDDVLIDEDGCYWGEGGNGKIKLTEGRKAYPYEVENWGYRDGRDLWIVNFGFNGWFCVKVDRNWIDIKTGICPFELEDGEQFPELPPTLPKVYLEQGVFSERGTPF